MTGLTAPDEKRLLCGLRGLPVDRPPFWLMRQAGRYLPEYRAVRAEAGSFLDLCYDPVRATEVTLQPVRRFGMDAAILFSDILVVPHGLGQALDYVEGEGPRLDPVRDAGGIGRLRPAHCARALEPVYEAVGRVRQALPPEVALIGFAGAPWTVAAYMVEGGGSKDFAAVKTFAYRDPTHFAALMDLLVEATAEHLLKQIAAGADVVQIFDSWAGALPESAFQRWVVAPTRRIVDQLRCKAPGIPVIGFPRGAGVLYASYAADTGVDAVGLDTGVPAGWACDVLKPMAVLQGNLDPVMLVAGGDALRRETERLLEAFGRERFVFNLGHGVLPSTPPENVAYLAQIIREWRSA
jgi:uroporphyrinogen decarboxylase